MEVRGGFRNVAEGGCLEGSLERFGLLGWVFLSGQERTPTEIRFILVESDTLDAMEALGSAADKARFDHHRKLTRFTELLEQHINLPALFQSLGLES